MAVFDNKLRRTRLWTILREPIDRGAACGVGLVIDIFDQFASNALAAHVGIGVKVLKIHDVFSFPQVAVVEVVDKAHGFVIFQGQSAMKILGIIANKPREGRVVNLWCH